MGNKNYETPPDFFRRRWELHRFTVDAAASDANALIGPHHVMCNQRTEAQLARLGREPVEAGQQCTSCGGWRVIGRYYTEETNGLDRAHYVEGDRVWCNPPYVNLYPWVKLALDCQRDGILWELLLPVSTSARWFKDLLWNDRAGHWRDGVEAHYVGRIQFLLNGQPIRDPKTGKTVSSRQDNMLVTLDPEGMGL